MGKIVLISGCGRGLGFCVVQRHLAMGDRIFAQDYRITDELRQLAEANPGQLTVAACDIGSTPEVERASAEILRQTDRIDILYNIAGIYRFEDKVPLAQTDMDTFLDMYNINAVGALRVCKGVWDALQPGSVIINISSEAGSIGACERRQEYAYCMSKAAMNMGAKIMSNELAARPVKVVNLHPGWMRTVMGGPVAAQRTDLSVSPEESAEHIVSIALDAPSFPDNITYMEHTRTPLPW